MLSYMNRISGISMDIAEDRDTDSERAYTVEQCSCPRGYKGLSCEVRVLRPLFFFTFLQF